MKKDMAFKLKAWMIYLICIALSVPFTILFTSYGYGTGEGIYYDIGSMMGSVAFIGGLILGFYYLIKISLKRRIKR